jgi:hypothetical protein
LAWVDFVKRVTEFSIMERDGNPGVLLGVSYHQRGPIFAPLRVPTRSEASRSMARLRYRSRYSETWLGTLQRMQPPAVAPRNVLALI